MDHFITPWGQLDLSRHPQRQHEQLRAWDASDEYLLRQLANTQPVAGCVVVIGDRWGALTAALARRAGAHTVVQISDSLMSQEATKRNLSRAGIGPEAVRLLSPRDELPPRIDMLLARVPKSLGFLEDQLHRLAPALRPNAVVLGTGMVKEIHNSTLAIFNRIIGPTKTSLAQKKARLILATRNVELSAEPNPWPLTYVLPADIGVMSNRPVVSYSGVFCADRLDIGTRLFLRNLPKWPPADRIVDLGCGNGVVGTAAALSQADAAVSFVDESYNAVASAEATYRGNLGYDATAEFLVADAMAPFPPESVDLVLCNPPFHAHQSMTVATSSRMFAGARAALRQRGELWVVGNRHLGYHLTLRKLFGNCSLVDSDPKFVVLRASKV